MEWTPQHEQAAWRVAEGLLTRQQIADEIGVHKRLLQWWISGQTGAKPPSPGDFPEFPARVTAIRAEMIARIREHSLATVEGRVQHDITRLEQLETIRLERANHAKMKNVPGGTTGLVVCTVRGLGHGKTVKEYTVDGGFIAEERALKERVSKELGQLTDKLETSMNERDRSAIETLDSKLDRLASRLRAQGVPEEPDAGGSGGASL